MGQIPLIETVHLKKYFSTPAGPLHAVDDINLKIYTGKTLGVVGESGCGKSTLGRVILRLIDATAGQVLFEGEDILTLRPRQAKELKKQMQIIFQDPYSSLDPRLSVSELIAEPILLTKTLHGKAEVNRRVAELMDIVKKKQTRIALKFIDRALKIFPANQELLIQKGQIAIGAGFFDIAEKAYAAVAAQPDPQIYVRRIYSSLLLKNGKFKQALKVLESILPDIEPDSPLQQIIPQQIEKTKELIKKTQL